MMEYRSKLPADPASMILGIISLVLIVLGCCCGLVAIVTLALAIVGLVMANKSLREFDQHPDAYSESSRKNVYAARIICIVSTVISAILILIAAGFLFFNGGSIMDAINKGKRDGHFEWDSDARDSVSSVQEKWDNDFGIKDSTPVVIDTVIDTTSVKLKMK